jgi:hypothetical protein
MLRGLDSRYIAREVPSTGMHYGAPRGPAVRSREVPPIENAL